MVSFKNHIHEGGKEMARRKSIGIRSRLKGLISGQLLGKLARESGFVIRLRKIDPVKFFWTLVLGFATGRERQIAGMRRAFQASTGTRVVPSSFCDRFSPSLVRYPTKDIISIVLLSIYPLRDRRVLSLIRSRRFHGGFRSERRSD